MPKVHLTWRRHDRERETHRHALDLVRRAVEARGYGRTTLDPAVWDPERWDASVITTWHHMGTTRMSATASTGVVDAKTWRKVGKVSFTPPAVAPAPLRATADSQGRWATREVRHRRGVFTRLRTAGGTGLLGTSSLEPMDSPGSLRTVHPSARAEAGQGFRSR